jgi:hypothetical protein
MTKTAAIEKSYGITEYVPANSVFIPEDRNEGLYVGVTATGFTAFTFTQEDVEASGLPMTEE